MNTLFSHVCVVTMDERMSVWTDAFVGVTDGKISYLSKHAPETRWFPITASAPKR